MSKWPEKKIAISPDLQGRCPTCSIAPHEPFFRERLGFNRAIDEGRAAVLGAVSVEKLADIVEMVYDDGWDKGRKNIASGDIANEIITHYATAIRTSILSDLGIKEDQ